MITAAQENARMLAAMLGINEEQASERLDRAVLITAEPSMVAVGWSTEICALLERTVGVTTLFDEKADLELVIGAVPPRTTLPALYAGLSRTGVIVTDTPQAAPIALAHGLFAMIAGCAVSAAVLQRLIDDPALPSVRLPLAFDFAQLGLPVTALRHETDLSAHVLIGAGAVAHGFLRALRHVPTRGRLPIIDPKRVGSGNGNRCLYLAFDDVDALKAPALAKRAAADFPQLTLEPVVSDFSAYVAAHGPVAHAIVTVDSRRARRSIQGELPGAVLDASTTDIRRVVVHSHRQPTEGACLACIYKHVPDEHARERAIAAGLGIDLEAVRQGIVSAEVAERIHAAHPGLAPDALVGKAFDSLFKQLCAEQTLLTPEGRQVLAPFAFVSNLAGALLAVELLRQEQRIADSNYWTVDPWGKPIARLRQNRPRDPDCEICSQLEIIAVTQELWGS